MKKRVISLLLTFCMLLSLLPVTAMADEAQNSAEAVEAVTSILPKPTETTAAASKSANPFADVQESDWYYNAVQYARANGFFSGTSETTFCPDEICTRGQMAAFMYRHDDKPAVSGAHPFEDVAVNDYYHNAVIWAFGEGITDGTSDNTFSPKNVCTRGQMVTFLYRFLAE